MKGRLVRAVFRDCLKRFVLPLSLLFAVFVVETAVFWLYNIGFEPLLYSVIVTLGLCVCVFICIFMKALRKHNLLHEINKSSANERQTLPHADTLSERELGEIIEKLYSELENVTNRTLEERTDMQDYYTSWVHSIKTPIAVLKLRIGDENPELSTELFRIEQYAEMALTYIRVEGGSTDLLVRKYELDPIICESVRKFAPQFINTKLRLNYEKTGAEAVTDKKWLGFMLDQLLSNALKYTPNGSISITFDEEKNELSICDTGVGIPAEDLPRIFDKGYTGANGRNESKSSGLGLYLAKKTADMLGLRLSVESDSTGSCFGLGFKRE